MARSGKPIAHTQLFLDLDLSLDSGDFGKIKNLVRAHDFGGFKSGELERITSLSKLFEKLEHKKIIGVGKYGKLKKILINIDREDVVDDTVKKAEDLLRKEGYKVDMDAADFGSSEYQMEVQPQVSVNTNNSAAALPSFQSINQAFADSLSSGSQKQLQRTPSYEKGRGYVLFINNFVKCPNGNLRDGCEKDTSKIEGLFRDHLPNYRLSCKQDLKKPELLDILQETKKELQNGFFSSFFLIIASHGRQFIIKDSNQKLNATLEGICTVDGNFVTEEDLTKPFMGDQLRELQGKPKVFIIQACRAPIGDKSDAIGDAVGSKIHTQPSLTLPNNADVLISYATTKGTRAWRNESGTWYIHHLTEILRQNYQKEHLMDLLVRVNRQVAEMESTENQAKQMPCQVSTLTKHILL